MSLILFIIILFFFFVCILFAKGKHNSTLRAAGNLTKIMFVTGQPYGVTVLCPISEKDKNFIYLTINTKEKKLKKFIATHLMPVQAESDELSIYIQ